MWVCYKIRLVLIHWMRDITDELKYGEETLHLAVDYMDRFVRAVKGKLDVSWLQGVGGVCYVLATKMNEVNAIDMREMRYLCCDLYTIQQLRQMEAIVLRSLEWELFVPTAYTYLAHLCNGKNPTKEQEEVLRKELESGLYITFDKYEVALKANQANKV